MQGGQDGEAKSWSSKAIRGIRGHHRYQRSSEVSEVILGIRGPPRPSEAIIRGHHPRRSSASIHQPAWARALLQSRLEACLVERPAEQDVVQDGAAHDERLGEHLMMEAMRDHQRA